MPAPERTDYILPNGKAAVLTTSVGDSYGGVVLDADGPRDISGDTLSVVAKLDTTSKALTAAAVSPQTGESKGRYIVTIPAAELDATGTLYVDVLNQKSGEEAKTVARWQFSVVAPAV